MNPQGSLSFWETFSKPIIGLAPMDGVTDPCFRQMVARHGKPDLIVTEFTSVEAICRGVAGELSGLAFDEIERPIIAQVYGAEPPAFFHAAQIVCALGFDGLDINMGCPAKGVASRGCGAALINDPPRAAAILDAARRGILAWASAAPLSLVPPNLQLPPFPVARRPIPLSVKTRIGYDRVVIGDWVRHLLESSPAAITLHGRTLKQGYHGMADWEAIGQAAEIARDSGTLILGNGDVPSVAAAKVRVAETGVDGVLIGRAALGRPWLFGESPHPEPLAVALEHARRFEQMYGIGRFSAVRKHLAWYCRGFPGAGDLRARLVRARSADEVEALLAPYSTTDADLPLEEELCLTA